MNFPKKITPDNLKDSIVEIRYSSKLPFEIALGLFFRSLDDTYTYTNRPLNINSSNKNEFGNLEIQFGSHNLFFNDKIKVEFKPNSLVFNFLRNYISWDIYKTEIEKVLRQLEKAEVFEQFYRIGIRYISEYTNVNITNCVKFSFSFGMPKISSDSFKFNSEFRSDGLRVILNLNNKLPNFNLNNTFEGEFQQTVSSIDIDVIDENINENSLNNLFKHIDKIHSKEKEIFFTLLKKKFLDTLNPIY